MTEQTRAVVTEFQTRLAAGDLAGATALLADEVHWDIAGDTATVPWIGRRHTAVEVTEFFEKFPDHLERKVFDIERIVVDGERAVVLGRLETVVRATGKLIESAFAIDMAVSEGKITRYVLFEDTWRVAEAVRP